MSLAIERITNAETYGRVGPPPSKANPGEWILSKIILGLVIAIFVCYLMPFQIAPALGVTPESYQQNFFWWTFLAGIISMPFAWFGSKLVAWLIRRS